MESREKDESSQLVEGIIRYQYKDERIISQIFDKMFVVEKDLNKNILYVAICEDIKYFYYKLFNCAKKYDK